MDKNMLQFTFELERPACLYLNIQGQTKGERKGC